MSVYHTTAREESEDPLPRSHTQVRGERRISEKRCQTAGEIFGITGAEQQSGVADDLSECAQIRSEYGQPAQHVFRGDEAEDFSAERRNDDNSGARQDRVQLGRRQRTEESHPRSEFPFISEPLERLALRAIADDVKLKVERLGCEPPSGFKNEAYSLRGYQASLKSDNGDAAFRRRPESITGRIETVRNGLAARQFHELTQPLSGHDVYRRAPGQEPACEREQPKFEAVERTLAGIAAQAFEVPARDEMAGAGRLRRLVEELAVRADSLEPVVLDNDRFAREPGQNKGPERRASNMHEVRIADQSKQGKRTRLANNGKRKIFVAETAGRRLRHQRHIEFPLVRNRPAFRKPARQGFDDGFHAADAGREIV